MVELSCEFSALTKVAKNESKEKADGGTYRCVRALYVLLKIFASAIIHNRVLGLEERMGMKCVSHFTKSCAGMPMPKRRGPTRNASANYLKFYNWTVVAKFMWNFVAFVSLWAEYLRKVSDEFRPPTKCWAESNADRVTHDHVRARKTQKHFFSFGLSLWLKYENKPNQNPNT